MDLIKKIMKEKYHIKGMYNRAINKPVRDMCLYEMFEEVKNNIKLVNKTGEWSPKLDELMNILIPRDDMEQSIAANVFLSALDSLKEDKRQEFIKRYATLFSEKSLIYMDECKFRYKRKYREYLKEIYKENIYRYGDYDEIARDIRTTGDLESVLEKMSPEQKVEFLSKRSEFFSVSIAKYIKELPKQYKIMYLEKNHRLLYFLDEIDVYDDITIDDILEHCRSTGDYGLMELDLKQVSNYRKNLTYENIMEELKFIKTEEAQKDYFNNMIWHWENTKLKQEDFEKLANDERISAKEHIYDGYFNKMKNKRIMRYFQELPSERKKDALKSIFNIQSWRVRFNEDELRKLYNELDDDEQRKEFTIRILDMKKIDRAAIIPNKDVIELLKTEDVEFVFSNMLEGLSQEELTDLFMETTNTNLRNQIIRTSVSTLRGKDKPNYIGDNVWDVEDRRAKFNIITEENYFDIFQKTDGNELHDLAELDYFDINHEGVLEKIVRSGNIYDLSNLLNQSGQAIDYKNIVQVLNCKIKEQNYICGILLKYPINWEINSKEDLSKVIGELSKITSVDEQSSVMNEALKHYKATIENVSFFDDENISAILKNNDIPITTRNALFSCISSMYMYEFKGYNKERLLEIFQTGKRGLLIGAKINQMRENDNDLLEDANDFIKNHSMFVPQEYQEELRQIIDMKSLEEKAEAYSKFSEKVTGLNYSKLIKFFEEYSDIVGMDYISVFKEICPTLEDFSDQSKAFSAFNYIHIIKYLNNEDTYLKFMKLYQNNKNVINTITPELMNNTVFEKIDENFLEYLSAYSNSAENISEVVDNEALLNCFVRCYDAIKKNEEFPEEKLSKIIKFLGKNKDNIENGEISEDECYMLTYIANYDSHFKLEEGQSIFDYEKMIKAKCDEKIKSALLTKATALDALGKRFLCMSYKDMVKFAYRYSADVDKFIEEYESKQELTEEEQNELIALKITRNIRSIIEIDDVDTIKSLYQKLSQMPEYEKIDFKQRIILDGNIRRVYTKDYKRNLYIPDEKDKKIVNGVEVYAPTDFAMFIHSVGAYSGFNIADENKSAKELWNSKEDTSSQEICTSYIVDGNMGSAGAKIKDGPVVKLIKKILKVDKEKTRVVVGFYKFSDNAIFMAGSNDLSTHTTGIESQSSYRDFTFKSAQRLTDDTRWQYNEVNIKRKSMDSLGENLQPDYVVCYDEVTEADKKVAKDFGIPIVLIDREKIAKIQSKKIDILFKKFSKSPDPKLIGEILNTYEGNWVSYSYSRRDLLKKYFNSNKFTMKIFGMLDKIKQLRAKGESELFKECLDEFFFAVYRESEKFRYTKSDNELFSDENLQIEWINRALSKVIEGTDYTPKFETFEEKRKGFLKSNRANVTDQKKYENEGICKADKMQMEVKNELEERDD